MVGVHVLDDPLLRSCFLRLRIHHREQDRTDVDSVTSAFSPLYGKAKCRRH